MRTRGLVLGIVPWLIVACGPGEVISEPLLDAAPDDREPPSADLGAPRDAGSPTDAASSPDAGEARDASLFDTAPPPPPMDAATCTLPSPAARPPSPPPDRSAVVRDAANVSPSLLQNSCVTMGGTNAFLFEVLRRLRAEDPRWGLNDSGAGLRGDVLSYFYGDGCPEGRTEILSVDIIARLCARPGVDMPPAPAWFFPAEAPVGRWTLRGFNADAGAPPPPPPPPPDVPPARVPLPDGSGVVQQVARDRPDLLRMSCREMGGNNEFLFEVVRRLRRADTRWGLNWKRGVVGDMSQDVVDYYFGPAGAAMEGSTDVYILDIIGGHCGATPSAAWIDVTEATRAGGTIGRWTLAGRTDL